MSEELLFTEDEKTVPIIPDIPCAVRDLRGEDGLTEGQMMELWLTAKDWLILRGVHLYGLERPPGWGCRFWHTPLLGTAAALPYAHRIWHEGMLSTKFQAKVTIAWGQDLDGRDIVLKLVDNGSPEHRIYQTLLQHQSLFTDPRTFPGVLPPITIIDTPHKYSIVTMPLWGTNLYIEDMQDVRQVLTFIRCLLEGLSFLHANRIAHRDIYDGNIIVSCYRPDRDHEKFRDDMSELLRGDDVRYAFMDFDQSIQLPLDVSLKDYRRPSDEAWMGWDLYKPPDVCLGQSQYNPFAFDVGTLGNFFRVHFWEAVPVVPALAPLFDGMATHVVSRRFTAQEALDFFKANVKSQPQDVLDTPVTLRIEYETMINPELYWLKLAPSVQAHWSRFRAPPLPRWWFILNWLMDTIPGCCRLVEFICRILGI